MSGVLIIAALLPVLFGFGFVVSVVLERRQAGLRQRIGHGIGVYGADLGDALGTLRLDARSAAASSGVLSWLPNSLGNRIEAALGATGGRLTTFHLVIAGCVGAVLAEVLGSVLLSLQGFLVLLLMLAGAIALPYAVVRFMQARFQAGFLQFFPDALDLIVRAVRAGLPVADAIENVANEIAGPVGKEFRQVHQGMTIGIELEEELLRAAERIRLIEFRFFIVALTLQKRTGGNLAETLENLSLTIRRRREMWLKARAMMSESRASAWLIGILPFIGGGAIYFINPFYIKILFEDPRGKTLLGVAVMLLAGGVFIMRVMIKRSMR
jgi:tight adherence protein B